MRRAAAIVAALILSVLISPTALAHDPNEPNIDPWYGEGILWSHPFVGAPVKTVHVTLSQPPSAGVPVKMTIKTADGFDATDSWMYGVLRTGCDYQRDCPYHGISQSGRTLKEGRLIVPLSEPDRDFSFSMTFPTADHYWGGMRIINGGEYLFLNLHIDVTDIPIGTGPVEADLPASIAGRTMPLVAGSQRPPSWLKPIAYFVLALLILAAGYALIRIPVKMSKAQRTDDTDEVAST